jgi:hypothetical protein
VKLSSGAFFVVWVLGFWAGSCMGCAAGVGTLNTLEPREPVCSTDADCREYCLAKYGVGVECDGGPQP